MFTFKSKYKNINQKFQKFYDKNYEKLLGYFLISFYKNKSNN